MREVVMVEEVMVEMVEEVVKFGEGIGGDWIRGGEEIGVEMVVTEGYKLRE